MDETVRALSVHEYTPVVASGSSDGEDSQDCSRTAPDVRVHHCSRGRCAFSRRGKLCVVVAAAVAALLVCAVRPGTFVFNNATGYGPRQWYNALLGKRSGQGPQNLMQASDAQVVCNVGSCALVGRKCIFDPQCPGRVGCHANGEMHCRYCGFSFFSSCQTSGVQESLSKTIVRPFSAMPVTTRSAPVEALETTAETSSVPPRTTLFTECNIFHMDKCRGMRTTTTTTATTTHSSGLTTTTTSIVTTVFRGTADRTSTAMIPERIERQPGDSTPRTTSSGPTARASAFLSFTIANADFARFMSDDVLVSNVQDVVRPFAADVLHVLPTSIAVLFEPGSVRVWCTTDFVGQHVLEPRFFQEDFAVALKDRLDDVFGSNSRVVTGPLTVGALQSGIKGVHIEAQPVEPSNDPPASKNAGGPTAYSVCWAVALTAAAVLVAGVGFFVLCKRSGPDHRHDGQLNEFPSNQVDRSALANPVNHHDAARQDTLDRIDDEEDIALQRAMAASLEESKEVFPDAKKAPGFPSEEVKSASKRADFSSEQSEMQEAQISSEDQVCSRKDVATDSGRTDVGRQQLGSQVPNQEHDLRAESAVASSHAKTSLKQPEAPVPRDSFHTAGSSDAVSTTHHTAATSRVDARHEQRDQQVLVERVLQQLEDVEKVIYGKLFDDLAGGASSLPKSDQRLLDFMARHACSDFDPAVDFPGAVAAPVTFEGLLVALRENAAETTKATEIFFEFAAVHGEALPHHAAVEALEMYAETTGLRDDRLVDWDRVSSTVLQDVQLVTFDAWLACCQHTSRILRLLKVAK